MVENLARVISEHPFCKGLKPDYLNLLTGCASNVLFDKGHHLFRKGGEANQFYLIREGKVSLEVFSPQHSSLIVETVEAGEALPAPFGYRSMAPEIPAAGCLVCAEGRHGSNRR